jgi:ABC-type enterobactin transport system permease subunit
VTLLIVLAAMLGAPWSSSSGFFPSFKAGPLRAVGVIATETGANTGLETESAVDDAGVGVSAVGIVSGGISEAAEVCGTARESGSDFV